MLTTFLVSCKESDSSLLKCREKKINKEDKTASKRHLRVQFGIAARNIYWHYQQESNFTVTLWKDKQSPSTNKLKRKRFRLSLNNMLKDKELPKRINNLTLIKTSIVPYQQVILLQFYFFAQFFLFFCFS